MEKKGKNEIAAYIKRLPRSLATIVGWELGKWIVKFSTVLISNFF